MQPLAQPPMVKRLTTTETDSSYRQFRRQYIAAPTVRLVVGFSRLVSEKTYDKKRRSDWLEGRAEICIRKGNRAYREHRKATGLDAELKKPMLRARHYERHSDSHRKQWDETREDIARIVTEPNKAAAIVRGYDAMLSQASQEKRSEICANFFTYDCKSNLFKCVDKLAEYGGYHLM